jgi:5-methylcytosine-specific restriction endonuclease McrA
MPGRIPRLQSPAGPRPVRDRSHYLTSSWKATRVAVLVRDLYRCRSCGATVTGKAAQVDHIQARFDGGSDALDNLQTLCVSCHGLKTRQEQKRQGRYH